CEPHGFLGGLSGRGHTNQERRERSRPSRLNRRYLNVTRDLPGFDARFFRHVLYEARAVGRFNRDVDVSDGFAPHAARFNQRVGCMSLSLLHPHYGRHSGRGDDEKYDQPLASPYPAQESIESNFVRGCFFFFRHLLLGSSEVSESLARPRHQRNRHDLLLMSPLVIISLIRRLSTSGVLKL